MTYLLIMSQAKLNSACEKETFDFYTLNIFLLNLVRSEIQSRFALTSFYFLSLFLQNNRNENQLIKLKIFFLTSYNNNNIIINHVHHTTTKKHKN